MYKGVFLMLLIIRLLLIILIILLIYSAVKYVTNPMRKLEKAHKQKKYFFYDDANNAQKNFFITYKGVMFEGEKYLGTTDNSFDVVSIFIWPHQPSELQGLVGEDFMFIESKLKNHYMNAKIDWKSPVKELMDKKRNQ